MNMANEIHMDIDLVNKELIDRPLSLFLMAMATSTFVHQPNLTEGLSLIGWRLKRNAEILARRNEVDFECEVEPSSTSYAAIDDNNDLCLEVDAINLNSTQDDDYDPYEVFMRVHSDHENTSGRHRTPLSLLPSQSTLSNNTRHYNFADDDTPIKYPLAIGLVDRRVKQAANIIPRTNTNKRVTFRSTNLHDDDDDDDDRDIAPTVTEMDLLDDDEDNEPITKSYSSPSPIKRSNNLFEDEQDQYRKRARSDIISDRLPTRRGRPPSQEDPSRKHARLISQFEEQHGLKFGDLRVFTPKLRLRISSVNVNWINLPSIPNFPNKVHPA